MSNLTTPVDHGIHLEFMLGIHANHLLLQVPIPDEMIPEDSRVEIDAKIHAGYCKSFQALS